MGFYECVYDCGDDNYCVSICSSLDNFESSSWVLCPLHKNVAKHYNLFKFLKRYSANPHSIWTQIKILESRPNQRNQTITKFELVNFPKEKINELKLIESKKIYFSEFDDEPSWTIIDDKVTLIDIIEQYHKEIFIKSPVCDKPNVHFNWSTYKVEIS